MATLRLDLGLPGAPFEHSYQLFQLCTMPTYLHTAWEFCNDHAFVVQDNQPNLKSQRTNVQFLMQAFADSGYNNKDLRLLNLCRLWAKVITLADITTGAGNGRETKRPLLDAVDASPCDVLPLSPRATTQTPSPTRRLDSTPQDLEMVLLCPPRLSPGNRPQ
jgi:hypothetical protein